MRIRSRTAAVVSILLFATAALAERRTTLKGTDQDRLLDRARNGLFRVIIGVADSEWQPEGRLSAAQVLEQRARGRRKKDELLARHRTVRRFEGEDLDTIPFVLAAVNEAALRELMNDDSVASIEEDLPVELDLGQSVPWIGASAVHQRQPVSYDGTGQIIVVIDYGVDHTHPFLADRVLHQHAACFSAATFTPVPGDDPPNDGITTPHTACPNGQATQVGPESTAPYPGQPCIAGNLNSNINGCYHGTKVTGIAAGRTHAGGPTISGVAPGAKIIPIQIAARKCAALTCDPFSNQSNLLLALDHVADELVATYGAQQNHPDGSLAAVNMSLGLPVSHATRASCDDAHSSFLRLIQNLTVDRDIAVVAATGNNSFDGATLLPSCISGVVAVSGSTDNDTVASYANTASFMDLFAPGGAGDGDPGTQIFTSTAKNMADQSTRNDDYIEEFGTSLAAPHVTGALALLRQREPTATVSSLLAYLQATGSIVPGDRAYGKVRIDVDLALNSIPPPAAPTNLVATGTGSGQVDLAWSGSLPQGGGFRIRFRDSASVAWNDLAVEQTVGYVHSGLAALTVYEYEVTALAQSGEPSSAINDYALTLLFSDSPLSAGITVRGAHIGELRAATDAWRAFAGVSDAFPSHAPATGVVAATDLTSIVGALNAARSLISGISAFTYSNPAQQPAAGRIVRQEHVQELRDAMK